MPLTSASNGNNVNKINIGQISTLPASLRNCNTYAVYNQIRTVNASRFIRLKEYDENGNNKPVDCPLDADVFKNLLKLAIEELCFSYDYDEKMELYLALYNSVKLKKCITLAYQIKKSTEETAALYDELANLLDNFEYTLSKTEINNGIETIFENAKKS